MTESPGVLFERLLDIMAHLRGPDGCPWDRDQTRASLKPFLIEEAYEVLEAIEAGRDRELREELGDLLLQVVFHARLGEEAGESGMAEVLRSLVDKLIRRHPHVFGDASAATPKDVVVQWEALKQREAEGRRRSVIDGVPRALPSLLRAQRLQSKAARVREELGDLLFSLVNVARLSEIDAEDALRGAIEKFRRRFTDMEADLVARGTSLGEASQDELERSWEAAKSHERDSREP